MRLQVLLVAFLKVALGDSLGEVVGYLGESVTLPSGADPRWKLTTIEWSIFSNNTWIATYRSGTTNTERVSRYTGRLSLDTSSADLTIRNLTKEDAMDYIVELSTDTQQPPKKIKLTVTQRLQEPTIDAQTCGCTSSKGVCWIKLHCSSTDKGVDLSWQVKPPGMTVFNTSNPGGNSAVLLAFLNTTQNRVDFTCTSSRHTENTSKTFTHTFDVVSDDEPQPQTRCRNAGFFFGGIVVGVVVTTLIMHFFGEKITDALQCVTEQCWHNAD